MHIRSQSRVGSKFLGISLGLLAGLTCIAFACAHAHRAASLNDDPHEVTNGEHHFAHETQKKATYVSKPQTKTTNPVTNFDSELLALDKLIFTDPQQSRARLKKMLHHASHGQLIDSVYFLTDLANEKNLAAVHDAIEIAKLNCLEAAEAANNLDAKNSLYSTIEHAADVVNEIEQAVEFHKLGSAPSKESPEIDTRS